MPSNPNALVSAKQKGVINSKEYSFLYERQLLREIAEKVVERRIQKTIEKRIQYHIIDKKLKDHGIISGA